MAALLAPIESNCPQARQNEEQEPDRVLAADLFKASRCRQPGRDASPRNLDPLHCLARHQQEIVAIDPYPIQIVPEPLRSARPNVSGRGLPEHSLVTLKRPGIQVLKLIRLCFAARRRIVVERPPQHLAAKSLPIRLGVSKVEVPSLIHRLARRADVTCLHAQQHKPLVLKDHLSRKPQAPSILASESLVKRETGTGRIYLKGKEALPELKLLRSQHCLKLTAHRNRPEDAITLADRMTYEDALDYISSLSSKGWRLGLDRMQEFTLRAGLEARLGGTFPKFIHVAGTNGKGSTTAFLQSLMVEQGYRTGAFFSPYVIDPRERVQIDRNLISRKLVGDLTQRLKPFAESLENSECGGPTEFEFKTALGFAAWARSSCEWVALEVGLGGRLDATNIVHPAACIIVSIGLDHTAILGDTHAKIAYEKAGIIKAGIPVIVGEMCDEALEVIEAVAREKDAPIWRFGREIQIEKLGRELRITNPRRSHLVPKPGIEGYKQDQNAALAVSAMDAANATRVSHGVGLGVQRAQIPGRFQRVRYLGRDLILDGSHNADAGQVLRRSLESAIIAERRPDTVQLVTNMLSGHDVPAFYDTLVGIAEQPQIVPISFFRALEPAAAREILEPKFGVATVHPTIDEGLKEAIRAAEPNQFVLVTGSNYLVGEAARVIGLTS